MSEEISNNKRIAKNTIYLYFRMILVMFVGLYTSRVVLNTLGVTDYGVYNVTGGVIGMLGYVNTLLSGSTSRFLTIDLARGDIGELKRTFSLSNTLCIVAALLILLLGETLGVWFLESYVNIESTRMDAAFCVYHCCLLSTVLSVLQTPYAASIISHEKMSIYAYMSILDATLKLLIVYLLVVVQYDKLKLYAYLLLSVNIINFALYRIYCLCKFPETNNKLYFEWNKCKVMISYSGWNMILIFANMLNNYGFNIILNIYFGTVVNAARGLALQISHITNQLYSNFQMASRPQIIKYYAQGNIKEMTKLICNTSKFSGCLILLVIIPIWFNIDGLLYLWLNQIPPYTAWFIRLLLLQSLFAAIDYPIGIGIQAVGRMKLPNLTSALVYLSIFPVVLFALHCGCGPISCYIISIVSTPIVLYVDMWILKKYTGFERSYYVKTVLWPLFIIIIISVIIPYFISKYNNASGFFITCLNTVLSFLYVAIICFVIGVPHKVKSSMYYKLKNYSYGK